METPPALGWEGGDLRTQHISAKGNDISAVKESEESVNEQIGSNLQRKKKKKPQSQVQNNMQKKLSFGGKGVKYIIFNRIIYVMTYTFSLCAHNNGFGRKREQWGPGGREMDAFPLSFEPRTVRTEYQAEGSTAREDQNWSPFLLPDDFRSSWHPRPDRPHVSPHGPLRSLPFLESRSHS